MADEGKKGENNTEAASGKKGNMLLFIMIPVLLIAGLGAGIFLGPMFMGSKEKKEGDHSSSAQEESSEGDTSEENNEKKEKLDPHNIAFINVPDVMVNLKSNKQRPVFLKVSIVLEIHDPKIKEIIENLRPKIVDQMQIFLRDLDITDVTGASNLERLRQELMVRVNNAVAPYKVHDVLIKDFLVQ